MLINPLLETLYTEQILSSSPPHFILFLCAPGRTFSRPVYAAALLFLVVFSGGGGWKWSRVVLVCFFLEHAFGIKLLISQPSVRVEEAVQGTR